MKIILMGDQHLAKFWKSNNSAFNRARKLIEYLKLNLEDIYNCFPNETSLGLIFAGDFFDTVHANTEMLVYIKEQLKSTLDKFTYIYAIAGNHETFIDKNGIQQSLIDIGLPDKIYKVINNIQHFTNNDTKINYILIPHMNNLQEILETELVNHLVSNYNNIIIGHFTPKEIFSYEKISINELIDKYRNYFKIPYVILGHYHIPVIHSYNGTIVISIGNSYYHTINDVRDSLEKSVKRYLILDDSTLKISSRPYILPDIKSYIIDTQKDFEDIVIKDIENNIHDDTVIYIKSNNLIDYSALTYEGYDVYFDLIENIDNAISVLNEVTSIDNNDVASNLMDRWNRYIELLPNITHKEKGLANWLFNKRNDLDIDINSIIDFMKKEDSNESNH